MAMKSCCCCLTLRQGTLGTAIYTIILSVVVFLGGAFILLNLDKAEAQSQQTSTSAIIQEEYDTVRLVFYIAFGIYGVWVAMAILMIMGVVWGKRWLSMPWLIYTTILLCLMVLRVILMIPRIDMVFQNASAMIQFLVAIAMVLGNIYCMVCVVSYFREMKGEPSPEGDNKLNYKRFENVV